MPQSSHIQGRSSAQGGFSRAGLLALCGALALGGVANGVFGTKPSASSTGTVPGEDGVNTTPDHQQRASFDELSLVDESFGSISNPVREPALDSTILIEQTFDGQPVEESKLAALQAENQLLKAEIEHLKGLVPSELLRDDRYLSLSEQPELQRWVRDFVEHFNIPLSSLPQAGSGWGDFVTLVDQYRVAALAAFEQTCQKYEAYDAQYGDLPDEQTQGFYQNYLNEWSQRAQSLEYDFQSRFASILPGYRITGLFPVSRPYFLSRDSNESVWLVNREGE